MKKNKFENWFYSSNQKKSGNFAKSKLNSFEITFLKNTQVNYSLPLLRKNLAYNFYTNIKVD